MQYKVNPHIFLCLFSTENYGLNTNWKGKKKLNLFWFALLWRYDSIIFHSHT